jgi:hypothetical protein
MHTGVRVAAAWPCVSRSPARRREGSQGQREKRRALKESAFYQDRALCGPWRRRQPFSAAPIDGGPARRVRGQAAHVPVARPAAGRGSAAGTADLRPGAADRARPCDAAGRGQRWLGGPRHRVPGDDGALRGSTNGFDGPCTPPGGGHACANGGRPRGSCVPLPPPRALFSLPSSDSPQRPSGRRSVPAPP